MCRIVLGLVALLPALLAVDKPGTAASEYQALTDEYRQAQKDADEVFKKAQTAEERRQVRAAFRKQRTQFVGRFLAFAEMHPKDPEALKALFFVLHPDIQAEDHDADKAAQLIRKDHIQSNRIGPILQMLAARDPFPAAEKLLRSMLEKNPHHAMQAYTCFSLAQILQQRADVSSPEQADRLKTEAEQLYQRVLDKYGDVQTVAAKAKGELFEIRHLAIGRVVPDIQGSDSDHKEFKLSDYRGKVVVLDFWAEW
jgi:hypothetical protein